MALRKLDVGSLGNREGEPIPQSIKSHGSIRSVFVLGDMADALLSLDGKGATLLSLFVGGDVRVSENRSGWAGIQSTYIKAIDIMGDLIGTGGNPVFISATGSDQAKLPPKAMAIEAIHIGGDVEHAEILAGSLPKGNGGSKIWRMGIGRVEVDGDWIAGSIAAGVDRGPDGYFGMLRRFRRFDFS
jgi:hypothetical protein